MITRQIENIEKASAKLPFFNSASAGERMIVQQNMNKKMPQNVLPDSGITTIGSGFEMKPLVQNARANFKRAEIELLHGNEAFALAEESGNRKLLKIARWHYEQCREKSGLAETNFIAAEPAQKFERCTNYCCNKIKLAHEFHAVSEAMLRKIAELENVGETK